MKQVWKRVSAASLATVWMVGFMLLAGASRADTEKNGDKHADGPRPERALTMAVEYPGIVVPLESSVRMDILLTNAGRTGEDLEIWIHQKPEAWKARIKTFDFDVTGVHVAADSEKRLNFEADPEKSVKTGEYTFKIAADSADGKFQFRKDIRVKVVEKSEAAADARGIRISTSYPVLRGPSDGEFEFSLEVANGLGKDAVFDLFAEGPKGWETNFKPAYETKYISSLRIKADQSATVALVVKPEAEATEGEYPVRMRVSSGDAQSEVDLKVALTGTYKLETGTVSGLLSLDARKGAPANVSFYIKNTGSAINKGISFVSFKPENWKVEFKPESIEALKPGDLNQVEMIVTPYGEALVGDYSVSVTVNGEKVSKNLEFRVSVLASAAWAWVGILIILAVVGGLILMFQKLGRR